MRITLLARVRSASGDTAVCVQKILNYAKRDATRSVVDFVNTQESGTRRTPLHYLYLDIDASSDRHCVDHGADLTICDSNGKCPLHMEKAGW